MSVHESVMVHPTAEVEEGARVGKDTRIWHFCHVMPGACIGRDCNLGQNVFVMSGARVGDRVKIQNNVSVYDGVELADDVFVGPSAVFTNVRNPRANVSRRNEFMRTVVEQGATIGANATVVCGTTLGRFCMVGAGAVVTRDVQPQALVTGVPARRTGWVCTCGGVLPDAEMGGQCPDCGARHDLG